VFSAAVIVRNLCQCVKQRLRFLKIRGSEAFGEPWTMAYIAFLARAAKSSPG
jgi:hypothetical protein